MLEATQPTIRFLSAATLTGGVTVLALMLTLLSISASLEHEFTNAFYFRVRRVSSWNMVLIVLSMVMLMVLSVPLEESESLRRAYTWVYFGAVLLVSLLGGILIAIVVMLNATVHSLVDVLRPGSQSSLIHSKQRGTDEERDLDAVRTGRPTGSSATVTSSSRRRTRRTRPCRS